MLPTFTRLYKAFTQYSWNYHETCNRQVYSNSDYYRITRYCRYRFRRTKNMRMCHHRQISPILAPEYWGNSHFSRSALMCNVRNNEGVADVHFSKRYGCTVWIWKLRMIAGILPWILLSQNLLFWLNENIFISSPRSSASSLCIRNLRIFRGRWVPFAIHRVLI